MNHQYTWLFDSLMGVGRFIRLNDGAVTLWDTGDLAFELNERFKDNPERVDAYVKRNDYEFHP